MVKSRILCVDDDPDLLDALELILSSAGYEVVRETRGERAVERVRAEKPDVVLLDATMPGEDGYAVCSRLQEREETSVIPVLFLTARKTEQDMARAFTAGAADYLVKPVDPKVLLEKIASCLSTRARWEEMRRRRSGPPGSEPSRRGVTDRWDSLFRAADFARFRDYLADKLHLSPAVRQSLSRVGAADLYAKVGQWGISLEATARAMAEFLGLPFAEEIRPEDLRLGVFPTAFCVSNFVVAVRGGEGESVFVVANPFHWDVVDAIRRVVPRGSQPRLRITSPDRFEALVEKGSSPSVPAASRKQDLKSLEVQVRAQFADELRTSGLSETADEKSAPIIELVNGIIERAYAAEASDIHIEAGPEDVVVRFRIDGNLQVVHRLRPKGLIRPVVARLKIMADLDIAEHRLPQDGRIDVKKFLRGGPEIDLRMATAPTIHGEKVVLRILDKQKSVYPLEKLGFSPQQLEAYRRVLRAPYGMILHAGPTGSGKSMSLYAALNELKDPSLNIQTVEDPVEYTLEGINQLQVNPEIGLTFARALRSFLRLDPDVILVGEIRDAETAHVAVEASLTGHLLLSTLHTNDAASTVYRFVEMGIEPYMVGSSLLAVCAQRLVRRLCTECRQAYSPSQAERLWVGSDPDQELVLYRPVGCDHCRGTGYRGRVGVYELLVPDDDFRQAMARQRIGADELKRLAVERLKMSTLFQEAMRKVRLGVTSVAEVVANIRPDGVERWEEEAASVPAEARSA
ncbi:MAG: ATPase, T2SS/T4P/T4SS family [Planctomycetota bacterium]